MVSLGSLSALPKMSLAPLDGLDRIGDPACGRLRSRLAEVGFVAELVAEADAFFPGALRLPRLPLVRWWLEQRPEQGARLARLFVFDGALAEYEAREALGAELLDALFEGGVLARGDDGVHARFLLTPDESGVLVLSDRLGAGEDAAMGPGAGTEQLARLLRADFSGTALDLGCGAGTLALVASRRGARRVVGVDVNARAVALARFNARLNGLSAEFHVGDGVAPVAGERFDLVVCQPPFVARPPAQSEHTFLYGGAAGDELPLRLLGASARVLAPDGRAVFLIQSAEREGDPLLERIRRALTGRPVHVLVVAGGGPAPARQAAVFAQFDDPTFGPTYAAAVRRYLDHFTTLGIRAFDGAIAVVTNPDTALGPGRYALALSLPSPPNDAGAFERFLRGLDLVELSDDAFERATLRLSPHLRMTPTTQPDAEGGGEGALVQIAAPGIGTDWALARAEVEVLAALHGSANVGTALDAVIQAAPPLASFRADLRNFARTALVHGALVRAD